MIRRSLTAFIVTNLIMCYRADAEPPTPAEVESQVIRSTHEKATRSGADLTIRFGNGKAKTFHDEDGCDKGAEHCVTSILTAYYPTHHAFVVRNSFYESGNYEWISELTGVSILLDGEPHLSPSGKQVFLTLDQSGEGFGGLQTGTVHDADGSVELAPEPLDVPEPMTGYYSFVAWVNETTIELLDGTVPVQIVSTANGLPNWKLSQPPK